jgi:putative nucleotidyltransferase with HDIG domain
MQPTERVLFVDDEESVRTAFVRAVKSKGYQVDVAASFDSALELAKRGAYGIVAVDYRLPEQDGLSAVDAIGHFQPHATYMLVSGQVDLQVAVDAVNEHNVSYVVCKPWDVDQLHALLQRSMDDHFERVMIRQVESNAVRLSQELDDQRRRVREAAAAQPHVVTETLLGALQARGHETVAHCRRVAAYALALAARLDITGEALVSIERGALLHDIGTLGVPDSVFSKSGPLTDAEWEQMRKHPEVGARMLEGIDNLRGALDIVMQHHERWDGSGYPGRRRGEEICIGARIFAVADALDALTSRRSYREAMSMMDAVDDLAAMAGVRYDPRVIVALQELPLESLQAAHDANPEGASA